MRRDTATPRMVAAVIRGALIVSAALPALYPSVVAADDSCPPGGPGSILSCAAGNAVGAVAQGATQDAVQAVTQWVVDTAIWLLQQLVNVIFSTSSPSLSADWFHAHYADMVAVAWATSPIFLLLGVVQALIGPDPGRTFGRMLGQLVAVAVLSTGVVAFAAILIGVVDQLSDFVSRNSAGDLHQFLTVFMAGSFSAATSGPGNTEVGATMPLFFLFLAGVLTVLGGILIWLELLARTLVIYAALLFFPVLLAAALWPRLSGMVQALAEVIVAVIVSKFIIVVIVAAGVAALTATGGSNAGPSLLVGAGLLLLAAWAPWKLYRLMPALEAAMIHQVGHQFQQARYRAQRATAGVRRAATTRSSSGLRIAGQRAARAAGPAAAPAAAQTAGAAAAGVATAGLATAAAIGTAGLRVAGNRVTGGVNLAGWQQHPVAPAASTPRGGPAPAPGFIVRPGPGVTRNPRPPASPVGGGAGG